MVIPYFRLLTLLYGNLSKIQTGRGRSRLISVALKLRSQHNTFLTVTSKAQIKPPLRVTWKILTD